ncbi:MAG TPA: hypothetical protein PLJ33_03700 [Peptococcaceae bacterium]|nr:hypothetical protein [Clostridia bacterium]HOB81638.1 hypothetical protein [Peptococcaceae bacterium]HPZ71465.1 hypothetical protein [Peptococcaceae bacterium]HQD53950.1 hypothetical protein [Peptococcaceae bacterium]
MKPDNAERSFKCSNCGHTFSRGPSDAKECPLCGFPCTLRSCQSLDGASNEDY